MSKQIVPIANTNFAVAVTGLGQPLVLASNDPTDPAQLWESEKREVLGTKGIAYRNVKTGLYAAFNGAQLPILAQSIDGDAAWMIVWDELPVFLSWYRLGVPFSTSWAWNVWNSSFQAGTSIIAWNDLNSNSVFDIASPASLSPQTST